jgi:hypothetical protein
MLTLRNRRNACPENIIFDNFIEGQNKPVARKRFTQAAKEDRDGILKL